VTTYESRSAGNKDFHEPGWPIILNVLTCLPLDLRALYYTVNPIRQTYPQTNIQTIGPLLLQLQDRGFDDAAILSVNRTYHLAMRL
jgi:hypothetical protein